MSKQKRIPGALEVLARELEDAEPDEAAVESRVLPANCRAGVLLATGWFQCGGPPHENGWCSAHQPTMGAR